VDLTFENFDKAVESEGPQSGRSKSRTRSSSAKRPTSARKSTRADEGAVKSQFLSFDEAQQMVMRLCVLRCVVVCCSL